MSDDQMPPPQEPPAAPPPPIAQSETNQRPLNMRVVAGANGVEWIKNGWGMFASEPLLWIVAFLALIGIYFFMSMIPLVSIAAPVVAPIINGGIMQMASKQDHGHNPGYEDIFTGFNDKAGSLAGVGLVNLGAGLVIAVIGLIVVAFGGGMAFVSNGMDMNQIGLSSMVPTVLFTALVVFGLYFLVLSAVWFAPVLIMLNDLTVMEALSTSFKAVMSNFVSFFIFGLIILVAGFVASIPLFLGWLVLAPVLMASNYTAYKDIFDQ